MTFVGLVIVAGALYFIYAGLVDIAEALYELSSVLKGKQK